MHYKLYIKIEIKNREDKDENDSILKYFANMIKSF